MFRDTKPNIDNVDYNRHNGSSKGVNPIYATFKGGCDSYNDDMSYWSYTFLWGYLRFCHNKCDIKDGWTWISLHGFKNGYTYTPVKLKWWNFNWHMAYGKKWPFIKIGFDNVYPLLNVFDQKKRT